MKDVKSVSTFFFFRRVNVQGSSLKTQPVLARVAHVLACDACAWAVLLPGQPGARESCRKDQTALCWAPLVRGHPCPGLCPSGGHWLPED